ncbi:MAG: APC family permease, partial [Candidatus Thermoplasmatota archaeon]
MSNNEDEKNKSILKDIKFKIIGAPRNIKDPAIFHKISLIALLSWIGLGADGLSSSAYGPAEAYSIISGHTYLALFLAITTTITILVISFTYSRIIEQFPHGGGGYIVATHTLGKHAGLLSGSSLLVDYVLTITVSLAACGDALFSFLPSDTQQFRLLFKCIMILLFIIMNLRGVKESVIILAPIFLLFLFSHILLLGYGIFVHIPNISTHAQSVTTGLQNDLSMIGVIGVLAILLKAFSYGAGTYTGLEAVSNGLPIMREPKVNTGKKTMLYMAISLSLIATGLFVCYFLVDIKPDETGVKTLNAILASTLFSRWPHGELIAFIIIISEGLLLAVAAQTGFIDGPRVMANMAKDSWLPKKFSALSERLVMQNGVLVMGVSALGLMLITKGDIT